MKICFDTNFRFSGRTTQMKQRKYRKVGEWWLVLVSHWIVSAFVECSLHILPIIITVLDIFCISENRTNLLAEEDFSVIGGGFSTGVSTGVFLIIIKSIAFTLMIPLCTLTHTYWLFDALWIIPNATITATATATNHHHHHHLNTIRICPSAFLV